MAVDPEEARERARVLHDAGEYDKSLAAATEGLVDAPQDVALLVLAGRSGMELDAPEAVEHLRKATELAPADAGAWHYYGEALAADGKMAEADQAFRRAVEIDPEDQLALTHLGHTALAAGRQDEGVGFLARAADLGPSGAGASTASISLVDMYRSFGQYDEALEQARRLADVAPDDVLGTLDVAELSALVGRLDDARAAFDRLREIDDVPGHEAYPLHGLIQIEIQAGNWERARELTDQAAAIDPYGLSADVDAFLREQIEGKGDEPAPTRVEVEDALVSSLADYRRMLADSRPLDTGDVYG